MEIWTRYIRSIKRNCINQPGEIKDLAYWRNDLFAGIIIYVLPLCLIALIPGLYLSILNAKYLLAITDILVISSIAAIAFVPYWPIRIRKIIFIILVYLLGCVMIATVGLIGSGQVYLLIACIFNIFIFPGKYALSAAIANTVICILTAIVIYCGWLPWATQMPNALSIWIATSSSLIFLSFLSALLIPRLFNGMQQSIENEKTLLNEVEQKKQSLQRTLHTLEEKNDELEQFAYVASHDLQEPLRMITIFLQQLQSKYDGTIDDTGKKYIAFAVDGANRMRQIIIDLLEYSRAWRTEAAMENVDLNGLVNDIKVLFSNIITEKKAVITTAHLPVIKHYKTPLLQLFQNMISNALKYSRADGQVCIHIDVKDMESHWQFAVSDNGIGISPVYFDKIFIIFQRLHNKDQYTGTGIGLAICKKIIDKMGGRIWVESEEEKGSAFYFTIPKFADSEIS